MSPLMELRATLATGLFTGAAVYVSLVEHPARVSCGPAVAITEFRPSYKRAAVLQAILALVGAVAAVARKLQLVERAVVTQADIEQVFTSASRENIQAVVVVSGLVTKFPSLVIRLAAERRLAIPGHRREWAEQGALFSYGANYFSVGRTDAARLVDRILKGTKPAALPVEQIARLVLVINLKTAKALGLRIPQSLLLRADELIQ